MHFSLPESAVVVRMNQEALAVVEEMENVRFVGRVPPAFKLDPDLLDGLFEKNMLQQVSRCALFPTCPFVPPGFHPCFTDPSYPF